MQIDFKKHSTAVPDSTCFQSFSPTTCTLKAGYDTCVIEDLETLGYSDLTPNPEITDCFKEAGKYDIKISLTDFANNTSVLTESLDIVSGTPDRAFSDFTETNCDDLIANNHSACTLILSIKDTYGNPVTQLDGATGKISSDSIYPLDANNIRNNGAISFRNGLRLLSGGVKILLGNSSNPNTFTIHSNNGAIMASFELTALAPSIETVAQFLGKVVEHTIDLEIQLPTVKPDGTLDTGHLITFFDGKFSPQLTFNPMVSNTIDLLGNESQMLIGESIPFNIIRNFEEVVDIRAIKQSIRHHFLPSALVFTESFFDSDITFFDTPSKESRTNETPPVTNPSITRATLDLNGTTFDDAGDKLSFSSIIEYNLDGKKINYPGAALGAGFGGDCDADTNCNGVTIDVNIVGASIEGLVLGNEDNLVFVDHDTNNGGFLEEAALVGTDNTKDIRSEIFENAHRITRNLTPKTGNLEASWFSNTDVVLVEGDLILDSDFTAPSGKKTLVIKNGNFIVRKNMNYTDTTDSFGVILINDKVETFPEKGNLLVQSDVHKIVGTYFLEGAIMTNDQDPNTTIYDFVRAGTYLKSENHQLLLEGTLLSHNTLGGSYGHVDKNYITPWGEIASLKTKNDPGLTKWFLELGGDIDANRLQIASAYDLHRIREYFPLSDPLTGSPTNGDKCVCTGGGCSASNASNCDKNHQAFVIRYDSRVKLLPPPGFSTIQTIAR